MIPSVKKGLLLLLAPVILLTACGKSKVGSIDPANSANWEMITEVEGHHSKNSERFNLKGNAVIIEYDVKSEKGWTHSNFKVFLGQGDEVAWENPEIQVFNTETKKGKTILHHVEEGSRLLHIESLEMDYQIKVYQRKQGKDKGGGHEGGNGH